MENNELINYCKVSDSLVNDVKSVIYSIYRMNAKSAIGYAFNAMKYKRSINNGEFIFQSDYLSSSNYDYYLCFKTMKLKRVPFVDSFVPKFNEEQKRAYMREFMEGTLFDKNE